VLEPGSIVGGKFQIERVLGAGGMGMVAVARHLQLDQRVAIKVLHDQAAADPATVQRFLREARAAARLKSDHICRVSDVGQLANGAPYMVMELLEGGDLASVLARGALAPYVAIDVVLQTCVGLAEAHAAGIVHRDLKPANLFVTRRLDGSPLVKILDFGIAKSPAGQVSGLTQTQAVMGTPGYMAPEQLRSTRDADARADIWALGVILYQALSGRLPFPANSITEFAVKSAMDPPDPIDIEPKLRTVVMRCLEKDAAARFPDVATFAQALAPFGGPTARSQAMLAATLVAPHLGTADTMMSSPPKVPTTLQVASGVATPAPTAAVKPAPRGVLIGAGLAAAAVLGGVVAVMATSRHDQQPAPPPPQQQVAAATPPPADATIAVDARAWPSLSDAAEVAQAPAPHPKHIDKKPQPAAVAPFVPPPPKPEPPPMADGDRVKAFDQAIATRHCQRAVTLAQGLMSKGPEYMQKATECINARSEALKDFASPSTEPWVLALAEDMAELGQPQVGAQQIDAYYYSRAAKDCQAKNAGDAKAVYAKIKSDKLREPAVQVCKAYGITLP
jgi:eukaryotic-like serine/threonine-protein kinase